MTVAQETRLKDIIVNLESRIELLNSNAEKDNKNLTGINRVIDLLIMLGHLDERAFKAAKELIETGLIYD